MEILRFPYQKQKLASFQFSRFNYLSLHSPTVVLPNPLLDEKQEEAYQRGDNLLNNQLDDWYPQVRPIESGDFCQINQDLSSYYKEFFAYYQKNPKIIAKSSIHQPFITYISQKMW